MIEHNVTHQHHFEPRSGVKITLTRGQKGGYGWEIEIYDNNPDFAMIKIRAADHMLRQEYLSSPQESPNGH